MSDTNKKEEALKGYVMEVMSESFIHRCPQCNIPVIKTSGSNGIRCICGCHWCYYCGEVLPKSDPYVHYVPRGDTTCPLEIGVGEEAAHERDKRKALEAGREAEKLWREMHPEVKGKKLDIEKMLD